MEDAGGSASVAFIFNYHFIFDDEIRAVSRFQTHPFVQDGQTRLPHET